LSCGGEIPAACLLFGSAIMTEPRFLIIDDHPLYLEALQSVLMASFADCTVDVADSIKAARKKLQHLQADLILLDLKLPDSEGLEGLMEIRRGWPKTPLAIISALADMNVVERLRDLGADGFIHKSQGREIIITSLKAMLRGKKVFPEHPPGAHDAPVKSQNDDILLRLRKLTPHQYKVLTRICQGKLNKQIAYEFDVAESTIKAHVTSTLKKLGVYSRTQAALLMQRVKTENMGIDLDLLFAEQGRGNAR
jgi:DNA-binding NarL/FixJ family response regulator